MKVQAYFSIAILGLFLMTGCGKKIDTDKTIEQIRTESESMSLGQLEAEAKGYIKEIARTRGAFEKTRQNLQGLKDQEVFGEKARNLQKELTDLTRRVSDLTEGYLVYAEKYEDLGGDVTKIKTS